MKRILLIAIGIILAGISSIILIKQTPSIDIVLSPHFDDAALPVGGLLAKSTHEKIVVTVFSGKPETSQTTPWDTQSGFKDSDQALAARVVENDASMQALAATNVSLGLLDFQYRAKDTDSIALQKSVQEKIEALLASYGDARMNIYFPNFFGAGKTHPDHLFVHQAVLAIIRENRFPHVSWYMYEDMPYTMKYEAQAKVSFANFVQDNNPDFSIHTKNIYLDQQELNAKIRSIQAYTSQLHAFDQDDASLAKITQFVNTHCGRKACEKVYSVKLK